MNEEEKRLKSLIKTKDAEHREMCICGIELMILKDDDIRYIIDEKNDITEVRLYYHKKIMEM